MYIRMIIMWEVMKYIMDAARETIETQRSSHIKGSDKGVTLPDKDVTSIAPLTTPVTMRSVQKNCTLYRLYRG